MIFLSPWVTADAKGGLKVPAQLRRYLRGLGGSSHQPARTGYIPVHCLPAGNAGSTFKSCILAQVVIDSYSAGEKMVELSPSR